MFVSGSGKHASDWLHNTHGFAPNKMSDKEFSTACLIRIGADITPTHDRIEKCACGKKVFKDASTHALRCKFTKGKKSSRHKGVKYALNFGIGQSKAKMRCDDEPNVANFFALKPVPTGVNPNNKTPKANGKKERGDILVHGLDGKKIMVDVVVCAPTVYTGAKNKTSIMRGEAAETNVVRKFKEG
jgi:hypothetical protein